jgi:hypothetical protein
MMGFLFRSGPKALKAEALSLFLLAVLLLALAYFQHWNYAIVWLILVGMSIGTAIKYLWWHFKPPKAREPQTVTR